MSKSSQDTGQNATRIFRCARNTVATPLRSQKPFPLYTESYVIPPAAQKKSNLRARAARSAVPHITVARDQSASPSFRCALR